MICEGMVYGVGCGVGISEIGYSMITGKPSMVFDKSEANIERGRELARSLGVDDLVEFIFGKAEKKRLKPGRGDVVIVAQPTGSLYDYLKKLASRYDCHFILEDEPFEYLRGKSSSQGNGRLYPPERRAKIFEEEAKMYFPMDKYDVTFAQDRLSKEQIVFIAKRK